MATFTLTFQVNFGMRQCDIPIFSILSQHLQNTIYIRLHGVRTNVNKDVTEQETRDKASCKVSECEGHRGIELLNLRCVEK
jgi:hypothetical protein